MRLYIAGPYKAQSTNQHTIPQETQRNVDRAIYAFHLLKDLGHTPFVPHLSHYVHIHPTCTEDYGAYWYDYDLTFLDCWAEGICMLPGWEQSKGSCAELQRARQLNLKLFYLVNNELLEVPR